MLKWMTNRSGPQSLDWSFLSGDRLRFSLVFAFAVAVAMFSWIIMPDGGLDMRDDVLPALTNWRMPWVEGTPLFPWAVLVLMPLRFLSPENATILMNFGSVMITALAIRRMGGNILLTIPVFVSPVGYWMFTTGQTDALMFGACILLPAGYDLLFFWKPQVILHAFWVRLMTRPKIYLIAGPLLLGLSLLIWGNWPRAVIDFARSQLIDGWWNRSFWPCSIPIGLVFLYWSIKKRDECYGVIASPLLSPYVNGPSYVGLLAVVAAKWPGFFMICYLIFLVYAILAITVPELHLFLI